MALVPGQPDSSENCREHIWPRRERPGGSTRSIGKVEHEQCNCCLSMRLTFQITVMVGNEVTHRTCVRIVEPEFTPTSQGDDPT